MRSRGIENEQPGSRSGQFVPPDPQGDRTIRSGCSDGQTKRIIQGMKRTHPPCAGSDTQVSHTRGTAFRPMLGS